MSGKCQVQMSDKHRCGRPLVGGSRPDVHCVMHSRDPNKSESEFRREVDNILKGVSVCHRLKKEFDFTSFVFPYFPFTVGTVGRPVIFAYAEFPTKIDSVAIFEEEVNFSSAKFFREAKFDGVVFKKKADFSNVTFSMNSPTSFQNAKFEKGAVFFDAKFGPVDFFEAHFFEYAGFSLAKFGEAARFLLVTFAPLQLCAGADPVVADFGGCTFVKPAEVQFEMINIEEKRAIQAPPPADAKQGFLAAFNGANVDEVRFADVNWFRRNDHRMILEDERRLPQTGEYELTVRAYRQLINNFEKSRAFDEAEDCYFGVMKVKRRDPHEPFASRFAIAVYGVASKYGSSYLRALTVLVILLVVFGIAFALPASGLQRSPTVPWPYAGQERILRFLGGGLFHALEVASFQKEASYVARSLLGRTLTILESIVVAAQLGLFLLALNRRFKR